MIDPSDRDETSITPVDQALEVQVGLKLRPPISTFTTLALVVQVPESVYEVSFETEMSSREVIDITSELESLLTSIVDCGAVE
jgi:hypothetical protein